MATNALGLIETRGLVGLYRAADAVTKTAPFAAMKKSSVGGGFHLLWFEGELAAVKLAVDAACAAIADRPEFAGALAIPMPHPELFSLLRGAILPPQAEAAAIGCIEMKGMVAALAGVDAACKAAEVRCGGFEYCGDGFIHTAFIGPIAAVQAALEGARAASERHGGSSSQGLLTRPLPECAAFILSHSIAGSSAQQQAPDRASRALRPAPPPLPDAEPIPVSLAVHLPKPVLSAAPPARRGRPPKQNTGAAPESPGGDEKQIRHRVRTPAREVPAASFEEKIGMYAEYEQMPVWQLRKVARQTAGIGIFGREISKANKVQLLGELKRILALG